MKWGLVPSWAADDLGGAKLINALADGVAEKPSFRS
jgi:putative SOS response-associated peptidase YedK